MCTVLNHLKVFMVLILRVHDTRITPKLSVFLISDSAQGICYENVIAFQVFQLYSIFC